MLLRGKHKPIFAPHVDTGDFVIVINADKVALTGTKLEDKRAYRHSGYPGGLRSISYADMMAKHPTRAVEKAIKGMLPENPLGRKTLSKLKVYAGPTHPHQAQQPQPNEIRQSLSSSAARKREEEQRGRAHRRRDARRRRGILHRGVHRRRAF